MTLGTEEIHKKAHLHWLTGDEAMKDLVLSLDKAPDNLSKEKLVKDYVAGMKDLETIHPAGESSNKLGDPVKPIDPNKPNKPNKPDDPSKPTSKSKKITIGLVIAAVLLVVIIVGVASFALYYNHSSPSSKFYPARRQAGRSQVGDQGEPTLLSYPTKQQYV